MNGQEVIKVLFSDDNRDIIELVKSFFSDNFPDIELTCVMNGHEALQHARAEHFHVLITDYDMPVVDGLDLVRALKTIEKSFRPSGVILLSSYLTEGEPDADLSFVHFVQKDQYVSFLMTYFTEKNFLSCSNDDEINKRKHPRYNLDGRDKRVDFVFEDSTSFGILRDLSLSGLSVYVHSIADSYVIGAEFTCILELDFDGATKVMSLPVEMVGQGVDRMNYIGLKFVSLGLEEFSFLKLYLKENY